jgi:hypothetical protein
MKLLNFIIIITLLSAISCLSQEKDSLLNVLNTKFQSFEYNDAVHLAGILLENGNLSKEEKLEILTVKGVALYNLAEEDSAKNVFIELLKTDNNYYLDPVNNSPKIVEFFNNIKMNRKEKTEPETKEKITPPEVKEADRKNNDNLTTDFDGKISKSLIVRSLVFPGWGHFSGGKSGKGWLLSSAGFAAASSMIYFIIDCKRKENEYLRETDLFLIEDRYEKYNSSYKLRNISIIAYAAIWIYSQIDLLYISDFESKPERLSLSPQIDSFFITYRIPL